MTVELTAHEIDDLATFDLTRKYGECLFMTRIQRWNTAYKFGLNPPDHIRKILERIPKGHKEYYSILHVHLKSSK